MTIRYVPHLLALLLASSALIGCGGGGGDPTPTIPSYTVTTTLLGGTASPAESRVKEGESAVITLTADEGYTLDAASVSGCDGALDGNTYTTGPVIADCVVTASFIGAHTVEAVAGVGGMIDPNIRSVAHGVTTTFTITPDVNFSIASAIGCGGSLEGNTYTTSAITSDCTVSANFVEGAAPVLYTVTATSVPAEGGTVEGGGNYGDSSEVTVSAATNTGYDFVNWTESGNVVSSSATYTFSIVDDRALTANFVIRSYEVSATVGSGGAVDPANVSVEHGSSTVFTFLPESGYHTAGATGCGGTLEGDTYTTGAITGTCTVSGTFALNSYEVSATAGAGGAIDPASRSVEHGASASFTVAADTGYFIDTVTGCGGTLEGDTYTTVAITGACTVSATFAQPYTIGGTLSGMNEGATIVLRNNGGDDLIVNGNGAFTFDTPVVDGGQYAVTIATQPAAQQCQVSFGTGTVDGADVTSVVVGDCVAAAPPAPEVTLGYGIKQLEFSWNPVQGATYYKLFENADGVSGYTQLGSNFSATAYTHPMALYNRVNARYQIEACNSVGCTASEEISIAEGLTGAIGYFKASTPGGAFSSVALSGDGTTLAVGAPGAEGTGAVYIFVRSAAGWSQQTFRKASNADTDDYFGRDVSLSWDGNTLAIGAFGEASAVFGDQSNNDRTYAGAAYIFTRSGAIWSQQAYIKPSNVTTLAFKFGSALQLSGDGNTLAVGAYQESSTASGINGDPSTQSQANTGAVYVFVRSGTTWSQEAYIKASNPDKGDNFGYSVALSGDGNTLAVGAHNEDSAATTIGGDQSDNTATDQGAVYVFTRSGATWAQQAYIKSSATAWGLGEYLAMSGDGNTLAAVGDYQMVYLFSRSGASWSEAGTVKALYYTVGLSMSADGNTLAVGSANDRSSATGLNGDANDTAALSSGGVYLFTRAGMVWSQKAYIKASNTEVNDYFGRVGLSADGATLAVGASGEDGAIPGICATAEPGCTAAQTNNDTESAGAVYLY